MQASTPSAFTFASPAGEKERISRIQQAVRAIPDFPKEGILFRDITTVLRDPRLFQETISLFADALAGLKVDYIVGIESRGFILGAPLATQLNAGFVPVRKRNKLPGLVERHEYDLEYGSDCVEIHIDAIEPGARVVIVDDLLATGGTASAAAKLVGKLNAQLVALMFLIELSELNGREKLPSDVPIKAFIDFGG
ncbi:MAG: adenine phosphoribosyltransferase [Cyanobacteria bacterium]|nr:adenine phosphoribosyltransferase [Cyanobacteriota bacterium]